MAADDPSELEAPAPPAKQMPAAAYALGLLLAALWGGNYVAVKVGVTHLPPVGAAGLRFVLGMLAVYAWTQVRRSHLRIQKGEWVALLVNAVLLFVQISLMNLGLERTTGANGTVLMSSYPVLVAVAAHLMVPGDQLTLRKACGLGLSLVGILAVFGDELRLSDGTLVGNLIVLSSAALLGTKIAYMKLCLVRVSRDKLLFWQALLSLPMFAVYSLLIEWSAWRHSIETVSQRELLYAFAAIGYQGFVIAGFCFMCWAWLLSHYQASKLATFAFVTPLSGLVLSNLILGDVLSAGLWLGAILVAAGVTIATTGSATE